MCLSIVDELNLDFTFDTHTLSFSLCVAEEGERETPGSRDERG